MVVLFAIADYFLNICPMIHFLTLVSFVDVLFYLSFPLVAGVVGWLTNWLAVKMLFNPREEKDFILFKFQGVFPKRQRALAEKLGVVVATEFLSIDDIKENLINEDEIEHIISRMETQVDDFLNIKMPQRHPWINFFTSSKTKLTLKNEIMAEMRILAPDVVNEYMNNIGHRIDIQKTVSDKVASFSAEKMESILHSILDKEFKFIELVGLVLGVIIGLVRMGFLLLKESLT